MFSDDLIHRFSIFKMSNTNPSSIKTCKPKDQRKYRYQQITCSNSQNRKQKNYTSDHSIQQCAHSAHIRKFSHQRIDFESIFKCLSLFQSYMSNFNTKNFQTWINRELVTKANNYYFLQNFFLQNNLKTTFLFISSIKCTNIIYFHMQNINIDQDRVIYRVLSFGKLLSQEIQQTSVSVINNQLTQDRAHTFPTKKEHLSSTKSNPRFSRTNITNISTKNEQNQENKKIKQTLEKICRARQLAQLKKTKEHVKQRERQQLHRSQSNKSDIKYRKSMSKVPYKQQNILLKQSTDIQGNYAYFSNKYQKMIEESYKRRIIQIQAKTKKNQNDYQAIQVLNRKLKQILQQLMKISQLGSLFEGIEIIDNTTIDQLLMKLKQRHLSAHEDNIKIHSNEQQKISSSIENLSNSAEKVTLQHQQNTEKVTLQHQQNTNQQNYKLKQQVNTQQICMKCQAITQNRQIISTCKSCKQSTTKNNSNIKIYSTCQVIVKGLNQSCSQTNKSTNNTKNIAQNQEKKEYFQINKRLQQAELKLNQYKKQLDNKNSESHQLSRTIFQLQQRLLALNEANTCPGQSMNNNNIQLQEKNKYLNLKVQQLQKIILKLNEQKHESIKNENIYCQFKPDHSSKIFLKYQPELVQNVDIFQNQYRNAFLFQQQLNKTRNSQQQLVENIRCKQTEPHMKNIKLSKSGKNTRRNTEQAKSPGLTVVTGRKKYLKQENLQYHILTPKKNNCK